MLTTSSSTTLDREIKDTKIEDDRALPPKLLAAEYVLEEKRKLISLTKATEWLMNKMMINPLQLKGAGSV